MKILITGAKGTLGMELVRILSAGGHEILETDRDVLDITDRDAVGGVVAQIAPEAVINTAAYNFVDNVEQDQHYETAYAVNALGPKHLAEAAKNIGALFIHYSTDYVFAGDNPSGYTEDDRPEPISRYGETKLRGEEFVRQVGGRFYICRLSKIFGKPGVSEHSKESFVHLMLRLAKKMPSLKVVHEEVGCPTYTQDIAERTADMLSGAHDPGVYHVINEGGGVTWYEFAGEIFDIAGVDTPFEPVSSDAFPKPAARPKFAALKNTKLPLLRHRREALKAFIREWGI